ncbi:uncharacterized protein GIQ15_03109 [Arthroderma uncinatum]|uniref:uncharacterized protein n=1 Tax=Arthroderma uncinatum TaxID=74035 RepID=UPI00144A7CE2|nr:uncharacterized protein GIQ15_03109 [Arthroderma uncinatum]KAF3483785.1 hypothetical protein GIQ15_03109 [Arthroderma uncinatum]
MTSSSGYTVIQRFRWPEIRLHVWLLVNLASSTTCLGIFSWFLFVQTQLSVSTPWVFPFMVATAGLGLLFVFFMLFLIQRGMLLPDIIILGCFVLFVLWLTGLIGTSIELYGTAANVNSNCQSYVVNMPSKGPSINTLAWLTQITICNCWKTAFAFELVSTVFYIWMLIISFQVRRGFFLK